MQFPPIKHGLTIGQMPPSMVAFFLAGLIERDGIDEILHIAEHDRRAQSLLSTLAFFAPGIDIIHIPAWDCPPYSLISPGKATMAARMRGCAQLARPNPGKRIIITTAAAAMQRLPPAQYFQNGQWIIKSGQNLRQQKIEDYALRYGYQRVDTTRMVGEFCRRGGLLDIFPPDADHPFRIDFFGDVIEDIRTFDPSSQLSIANAQDITLTPADEIERGPETIHSFKIGYASLTGEGLHNDPFYRDVVASGDANGIHHWLALFQPSLVPLHHYLDKGCLLSFDADSLGAMDSFVETVHANYDMRRNLSSSRIEEFGRKTRKAPSGNDQNPRLATPKALYLDKDHWRFPRMANDNHKGQKSPSRDGLLYRSCIFSPFTGAAKENYWDANGRGAPNYHSITPADARYRTLARDIDRKRRTVIALTDESSRRRVENIFSRRGLPMPKIAASIHDVKESSPFSALLDLDSGFSTGDLLVIGEQDLFGGKHRRSWSNQKDEKKSLREDDVLNPGELLVHRQHGIGRYQGLKTLDIDHSSHDCLEISYRGGDILFVPVENIEILSRYGRGGDMPLDKMGSTAWTIRREAVKKRLRDLADHLLKTAARRSLAKAPSYRVSNGPYEEFCARFPFPETDDQRRAIDDVLSDLSSGKPMDRLICGDVGFGKTEIALRATFVIASQGCQVAVLTPTTLLARQHRENFENRFRDLPFRIGQLSRFTKPDQAKQVRDQLREGTVDIVIGTHALLAPGLSFHKLGLAIIDEEQHFGVRQKEALRRIRDQSHILSLSATPIPRTLQFSLSGVRDMSLISTPPSDRLSVRTFVTDFDPIIIREALMREHDRDGRSFYIVPRVSHIDGALRHLKKRVPELSIAVAHGQMTNRELEKAIGDFYDGRYDVLLATPIIESGLDIPQANTLIVERADMFGLAQMHQIRGRIGRADRRGWAYFLLPRAQKLTNAARHRLEALSAFDSLGAGFAIASHDLDLRGGGNLLGSEQSGHIREVGAELYQRLLREAIMAGRSDRPNDAHASDIIGAHGNDRAENPDVDESPDLDESPDFDDSHDWSPQIHLGVSVLLPSDYIPALDLRMGLYRRGANLKTRRQIEDFAAELKDRFGPLPEEADNFLAVLRMKEGCLRAGIEKIETGPKGNIIHFRKAHFANVDGLLQWIEQNRHSLRLRPDHCLIARSTGPVIDTLNHIINVLADLATHAPS